MAEIGGSMTGRDERDALAGEYVLGTLDAVERRAVEARIAADPEFRAAVAAWQMRLQPLADAETQVAPPAGLLERIEGRLEPRPATGSRSNLVSLRRSVTRWRLSTAFLAAAAASLGAVVVLDRAQPPPQSEFVAVLTESDGAAPAFVATVDIASRTIVILRVASPPPPDKSYELWSIAPNAAPRSLGVVEQASLRRIIEEKPSGDLTLAITLEQKGGSPTGAPQGPLVFKGTLLPTR